MTEERRSFCRTCAAACGVLVAVDGDRVVGVRGDPEHPGSHGYTCPKGRALGRQHHDPARLDHPVLRGRRVGWDELLDDLAEGLASARAAAGPDAVGFYLATGFGFDAAAQVASMGWFAGQGSRSLYTAATVDNAPVLVAAELVTGSPFLNPVWDPSAPGLLLAFGINPAVSHGYGTAMADPITHLRRYRAAGGRVWALDPRRHETAAHADRHLPVRPGSDTAVLAWLVREVLAAGPGAGDAKGVAPGPGAAASDRAASVTRNGVAPGRGAASIDAFSFGGDPRCAADDLAALRTAVARFDLTTAAAASGLPAQELAALRDEVLGAPGRLTVMCGTGVTMSRDGVLAEWLRWALLALTGSLDVETGMRFNRVAVNRPQRARPGFSVPRPGPPSRPDLSTVVGQYPCVALVDEIEAGNLRALVVGGGNPLTAFPDVERTRAALGSLEVLAVVDVVGSELTDLATHVLPATGQLERADLTLAENVALRSALQHTGPVVPAVGERRPAWWVFAQLGRRVGPDLLAGVDPDLLTDELFLAGFLDQVGQDPAAVAAAGPHGLAFDHEHGWVADEVLPKARWRLAPPVLLDRLAAHVPPAEDGLVLTNRRETRRLNSVDAAGAPGPPVVRLHPADVAAAGLDGWDVRVTSRHGSIVAPFRVDDAVRPGTVSVNHGRAGANVAALTSATEDVDPLTGMPHTTGVEVTITPP